MNKIIKKIQYTEKVFRFDVEAPLIAKSRKAGNFVIIRVDNNSERMPLTIADADIEKGTITLVVQKVGLSSTKLCALNEGDEIHDVVGPLGNPTHIENFGTVICAGGGVGVAPMLPIIKALKAAGNRVLSVIAGRSKDLVIMEDEVRASSDELIIMTDDGSYGEKGVVTVGIEKLINQEHIDRVFAIGPPIMMKFCCLLTQKYNLPTDVSLNTIMVDGTGMCGACRLTIGGKAHEQWEDGTTKESHNHQSTHLILLLRQSKQCLRENHREHIRVTISYQGNGNIKHCLIITNKHKYHTQSHHYYTDDKESTGLHHTKESCTCETANGTEDEIK